LSYAYEMQNLKNHLLVVVESKDYTQEFNSIFNSIFKSVVKVENNISLIKIYKDIRPSIVFLDCYDETFNTIDMIKEIRKIDRQTYIIVFTHKVHKVDLLKVIPLQIFDCIIDPIDMLKIKRLLKRLNDSIELDRPCDDNYILLKSGYKYCPTRKKLYNTDNEEISLTSKEISFLDLLISAKGHYISIENIEYALWEEDSLNDDCTGRLKTLINGMRKKLPNGSIENQYGVGYRLFLSGVMS